MQEPEIQVGLLSNQEIQFSLQGIYHVVAPKGNPVPSPKIVEGEQHVYMDNGLIKWNDASFKELLFFPIDPEKNLIKIRNVMIGKQFHWQQQEDQSFQGALHLIIEEGEITAINIISTERYLTSVISSTANSSK